LFGKDPRRGHAYLQRTQLYPIADITER
jgi:hypothetical protein